MIVFHFTTPIAPPLPCGSPDPVRNIDMNPIASPAQLAAALPRPIHRAAVIGGGTMGRGIAMCLADAHLPVTLLEASGPRLDAAMASITQTYEGQVRRGRITAAQAQERLARIAPSLDDLPLAGADLIIEAAFEDMQVKTELFRKMDRLARPGAILATNTSALDVDAIAALTARPQDVVGLHFFSPAHLMKLLEVVRGRLTAPDVLATALALGERLGKVAVVAGVCDGFIGNRILARYQAAANYMVAQGATPTQVDEALQAFGFTMGPLRMGDLAGLDIGSAGRKRRAAAQPGVRHLILADALADAGRHGQKTAAGWYRYESGHRAPLADPLTDVVVQRWRAANGITPRPVADEEIVQRCLFAMANEGAAIVADGIAASEADVDAVYVHGYGFPARRGGPMQYARDAGLARVVQALAQFERSGGDYAYLWRPTPALARLARDAMGQPA